MKDLIKKFIPNFLLDRYHFLLAFLGAVFYGFPSRKLKVVGVTGTNGKTTTTEMISRILEEAGYKVALMNSIRFKIGAKEWQNTLRMTMPGRFKIQKFLKQAVNSGCQYAVLEVTSEGIKQHRHKFIKFDVAVFTNLAPEHIETHGSFEKYRRTKGKLFQVTKHVHIVNLDDNNAEYFLQFPAKKKYLYKFKSQNAKCKITIQNSKFTREIDDFTVNLKLSGEFNIYNSLAAICVGISQGVDLETCKMVVEKIEGIPGRMEEVISEPFKVFVDYAFTPNALEKVYQIIQNTKYKIQNTKMICVLGACGGGRDKWKRPVLGEIAAKYCDEIIVTNEDPYDEEPMEIIEQVASGAQKISVNQRSNQRKSASIYKILDRREAIKKSLELAKTGDTVIITGKGCEPSICLAGGKKIPWDDRKVVKEELKRISDPNLRITSELSEYSGHSDVNSDHSDRYEILEHKADLKIRAFGKTKEELFESAMIGMFEGARYEEEVKSQKSKVKIKISSIDLPSLLVDFLSEILYLVETKKEVYQKVNFKKFLENEIEAELIGKRLKRMGVQIKAVTYHSLDIHQRKDKIWETTILFDI